MGHYLDLGTRCCGLGTLSRWLSYKDLRNLTQKHWLGVLYSTIIGRDVEATISGLRHEGSQRDRVLYVVASGFF